MFYNFSPIDYDYTVVGNYLVLGGSGFIGHDLVFYLKNQGHSVKNFDILENSSDDLRFISIPDLEKYDACFFLAWDVGGSKYLNDYSTWKNQFRNNLQILTNVLPQLDYAKIRTLFVSSQLAGVSDTPYALTKKMGEIYALKNQNFIVARQWNVYGSIEENNLKSHVVSDLISQALKTGEIRLLTTGNEKRKFIHIFDVCTAYEAMINSKLIGIYDVCGSEYISILEIAKLVAKFTGAIVFPNSKKGFTYKVKEINKFPGWQPKVELESGIKLLIESKNKDA